MGEDDTGLYRPNVGVCLFNSQGRVFVGERIDTPGAWQMPQGGIDGEEDIARAAKRELKEEIGTDKAGLLRVHPSPVRYIVPPDVRARLPYWNPKFIGQEQTWVAMRFTGVESDIRLDADEHPEFSRYQWIALHDTLRYIVPFKRDVYEQVIAAFADLASS